jgi:predicted ATPase
MDPASEQQRVFESVVAACELLATQRPLIIVIDDGHWADSGSLRLLRHVIQRTRRMRVLVVAAYRDVELDEARPWQQMLIDLNRKRLATRIKLRRLEREQTRSMLAAMLQEEINDDLIDAIYAIYEAIGSTDYIRHIQQRLAGLHR